MTFSFMDPHAQSRLEALELLLREADPGLTWDQPEVLRRAVDEGLRVMLAEVLAQGRRRGRGRGAVPPVERRSA